MLFAGVASLLGVPIFKSITHLPPYMGILFGLGWALAGACPGPMFVLIGHGVVSILVVIFGATLGAFLYGTFKNKLPH